LVPLQPLRAACYAAQNDLRAVWHAVATISPAPSPVEPTSNA
jgi:hypothetical protein